MYVYQLLMLMLSESPTNIWLNQLNCRIFNVDTVIYSFGDGHSCKLLLYCSCMLVLIITLFYLHKLELSLFPALF